MLGRTPARECSGTTVALLAGMQRHISLTRSLNSLVLAFACLAATVAWADESAAIEVRVSSGRTFSGQVDAQTDDESLVLRTGSDRAWIRRTVRWDRILGGQHAGRAVTVEELRAIAERVKTWPPVVLDPDAALDSATQASPGADVGILLPPVISSITFDAVLANWDGDVEADGLIVHLMPIDLDGFYAATRGTVEIELFARERRAFHHAPMSGGRSVAIISRWTCAVSPSDFGPNGAVLKFPFAAAHPEFTGELGSYGLVHVRMSVPGSGAFEDSQDGVRIRPFTPLRDTLQLSTGERFLPTERTGRGKGSYDDGR